MTNTRTEILAILKRNGGHSVQELAQALGLAPITVRQHLTRLQRDGLVASERHRGSAGRPSLVYRLTARGHAAAFPRRTDKMVELLIREIGHLEGRDLDGRSGPEKAQLVLERLAARLADEFLHLLQGWSLPERVAFVTEVMHLDGGFAEWAATGSGYEIRDYNCLFRELIDSDGTPCTWHQTFLTRVLGATVRVIPCDVPDRRCCRFLVETAPPGDQAGPERRPQPERTG